MPPVFLLWPRTALRARPPRSRREATLSVVAGLVAAASIASGVAAIVADLGHAFRYAGPSVFTPGDRAQLARIRAAVPPGAAILLLAAPDETWQAPLWQRALYPGRTVLIRYSPVDDGELRALKTRFGIRYALAMGDPPPDPGFRSRLDLGTLAGRPTHASFGELAR